MSWCGRSKTGHYDLVSCTLLCARACSKVLLTFSTTTTDFFSSPPARLLPHSYMSGQNLYLILDFKEILKIVKRRYGTIRIFFSCPLFATLVSSCHICRRWTPGALILNHLLAAKTTERNKSLTSDSKFSALCCSAVSMWHPNMSGPNWNWI